MRAKSNGLAFNFTPAFETPMQNFEEVTNQYVIQDLNNFVLINFYKYEKKQFAVNQDGFQSINRILYAEMPMIDTNPRNYIYDGKESLIYKVIDMPINPSVDPSKKKLVQVQIELVNTSDLKFDLKFIKAKYDELFGVMYAAI